MITAHHLYTLKKIFFTLLAVLLSAFLFVILVTYTPNDPSWSRISSDMVQVSNMGGAVGAWLSDLLYTFLGWPAWWLLAFIVYEAICLWWQREQQAFGPLRAIAYVFMMLASCGLLAALPQVFGFIDNNGARFGGILGAEVASRLSGLITPYGASAFLLIFSLITATFAFDIHWKQVFKEVFSLSWLGSGIQRSAAEDELEHQTQPDNYDQLDAGVAEGDHDQQAQNASSPLHRQLKLNLSEASEDEDKESLQPTAKTNLSPDTDPALSNVLDDFLVSSGLTESILALREQESEEARLESEKKTAAAQLQTQSEAASSSESRPKNEAVFKKQEPSFAWNDQNVINELLDEQALPVAVADTVSASTTVEESAATQSEKDTLQPATNDVVNEVESPKSSDLQQPDQPAIEPADDAVEEKQAVAEITQPASTQQPSTEQETVEDNAAEDPVVARESEQQQSTTEQSQPTEVEVAKPQDSAAERQPEQQSLAQPSVESATQVEEVTANTETEELVDQTPTNTPPANPKKPHDPSEDEDNKQSNTAPTIRFATPEGSSGNVIEDMVPDTDDEEEEINLPDIADDAAFASSSRAMQTAKYRESLSPIPELTILDKPDPDRKPSYTEAELEQLSELLEIKLQEFNVKAEVVNAIPGPVVTRFEVDLAAGVKASKVTGISRDLARSLSMASLRVVEVIPGKPYIGIEVPNKKREMVRLIELLQTEAYQDPKAQISMAMGKDIGGKPIITDLARAPHMLVAGTTGSGKSVLVNAMLLSILLKYKPSELRLILIDPKQLELANYNDIPHLLTPVVTDMNEAASSLAWCVAEMERRYQLMSLLKVRKLSEFNKKVIAAEKAGKPMIDPLWRPNDSVSIDQAPKMKTLPMIVIVADEFADMIMQVGKQAEELITRLAQKSRAAGIHLMLATQRPSVDVITGLIKANIPVRAALRVNSKVDSRTILDAGGAEDMLGNGDMLFLGPGQIEPDRVHGAYVSDEEVNRVCDAWRERGAPDYIDNMASNFDLTSPSSSGAGNTSGEDDALYDEAVAFVMETRKVSASSIQRKFSIGYNRAARIVDSMEEAGLVSAMGKSGKRELLM